MLIYTVPNIINIFYDKESELLIHEWIEYNPENQDNTILAILQKIYELLIFQKLKNLLIYLNNYDIPYKNEYGLNYNYYK